MEFTHDVISLDSELKTLGEGTFCVMSGFGGIAVTIIEGIAVTIIDPITIPIISPIPTNNP